MFRVRIIHGDTVRVKRDEDRRRWPAGREREREGGEWFTGRRGDGEVRGGKEK